MATWNFLIGCTKKSAGCRHCYAIRQAWRMMHNPNPKIATKFEGTVHKDSKGELNWTGRINFDDDTLAVPLKWRLPRRIFVNSLSDLFHPNVQDAWIDAAFAVMALCPQHTFQILTKHPDRAAAYFKDIEGRMDAIGSQAYDRFDVMFSGDATTDDFVQFGLPLPNVQILTSVEDQPSADERIPWLMKIPAAVRGISAEPLLGPINLAQAGLEIRMRDLNEPDEVNLNWVIAGGESGPSARPSHPDWFRDLRDQCIAAEIPFFFKQWGAWSNEGECDDPCGRCVMALRSWNGTAWRGSELTGTDWQSGSHLTGALQLHPVGKKAAGRLLDGVEWNQYPAIAEV